MAASARAIDLEKLVMPGPVIEGHADLENDCGSCHSRLRETDQNSLCRACHEEVSADLDQGAGFHGRAIGVGATECRVCHSDHLGRSADIVGIDPSGFDHEHTDYPLHGAHMRVPCAECHAPASKHREAPQDCFGCHQADDPHRGELGDDCGSCHGDVGWRQTDFDHDRTDFPLLGRHADVACSLCHPGQRFRETPAECSSCHRLDDVHRGRFGKTCGECHTPDGWKESRFDHARDAHVPLRGAHARVACEGCHVGGLAPQLSRDCVSCHEADDVHRGRNGRSCDRCHGESDWKAEKFDHDAMTDFPLRGSHARVKCERCHAGGVEEPLETRCVACHELDDVHAGQLGTACSECHNEVGWSHRVFFEHDLTDFPLLGLHAIAACEQCHATQRFAEAPAACWDCHASDDEHLRRLGTDCAACHNPNGWARWRFEHDVQTSFALHGGHEHLDCHACHRRPVEDHIETSADCVSCHARDDRHRGAFGTDCGRCHSDASWEAVEMRNLR